jgi:hypothetical protein
VENGSLSIDLLRESKIEGNFRIDKALYGFQGSEVPVAKKRI